MVSNQKYKCPYPGSKMHTFGLKLHAWPLDCRWCRFNRWKFQEKDTCMTFCCHKVDKGFVLDEFSPVGYLQYIGIMCIHNYVNIQILAPIIIFAMFKICNVNLVGQRLFWYLERANFQQQNICLKTLSVPWSGQGRENKIRFPKLLENIN